MNLAKEDDLPAPNRSIGLRRKILIGLSLAIAGIAGMVCSLVGGIIHLYATFLAYQVSGLAAAILTLCFPVVAELYWIGVIWSETDVFWHGLTIASAIYLALCAVVAAASRIAASVSE